MPEKTDIAVFGQGCFWCADAIYSRVKGVLDVVPGYAGGHTQAPTYDHVCMGNTGHAEVVKVTFDPSVITYEELLKLFFSTHDPTSLNRQGADVGTEYRSIILYASDTQKKSAEKWIKILNDSGALSGKIVTELKPLEKFHEAESYHHKYFEKNPDQAYCQFVIVPKIKKLLDEHADMLK